MQILRDKNELALYIADCGASVIDMMRFIDAGGKRIAFLTKNGALAAAITDGDVRRFILKGGDLEANCLKAANMSPKFVESGEEDGAAKLMAERSIDALPVISETGEIIAVALAGKHIPKKSCSLNAPVIIMAGGKGTRLYPYTKILPKPLIPIGDLPILEHIIKRYTDIGARDFYLVLNHKKNMIKSYMNDIEKDYRVTYIDEEKPLGTGGGLSLLKGKIDKTAFMTNCDILIDADYADIYAQHKKSGNAATMICAFKHITIPYGVVKVENGGDIQGFEEKPEFSFMVNTGMYIIEPRVIESLADDTPMGMPDIFDSLRESGEKVGVYPIGEKDWMDMGQLEELENMRKQMGV